MGGLSARQRARLVFGLPGLLLLLVLASWDERGQSPLVFLAVVTLLCVPVAIVLAAGLSLGNLVLRRRGASERTSLEVATYGFAMALTVLAVAAIGAWGIAMSYDDFCASHALPEVGSYSSSVSLLPPGVSCEFGLTDGETIVRGYDLDLYVKLGAWLAVLLGAMGSVHLVLTRTRRQA